MGETHRLNLPNVPREADVRKGDLIVTSGLGNRFPGGYPVATVSLIDREEGQTFARVEAAPLAALDRGREVLLISVADPAEIGPDAGDEPAAGIPAEDTFEEAATAEPEPPPAAEESTQPSQPDGAGESQE